MLNRNERLHNWLISSFQAPFLLQTKDTDPDLIYPSWHVYPHVVSTSRLQPDAMLPFSNESWHFLTVNIKKKKLAIYRFFKKLKDDISAISMNILSLWNMKVRNLLLVSLKYL